MTQRTRLGDLQLAIMRVLWAEGEATVAEVHQTLLDDHGLALTTIATMLKKMAAKGVVAHRSEGRQFVYRPTVDERDVHRTMVEHLIDRLFDGSTRALLNHLVEEKEIDVEELSEITKTIRASKRQKKKKRRR